MNKNASPSRFTAPLSSFGKSKLDRINNYRIEADVEHILKQIHSIETEKKKSNLAAPPDVVKRLLQTETEVIRSRSRSQTTKATRPKKEIREVKKRVSPLDAIPSAAHYRPNFNAVLASAPTVVLEGHSIEKESKEQNLDSYTMNEMIRHWQTGIREVNFVQKKALPQIPVTARTVRSDNASTASTPFVNVPGIVSGNADRSSYLVSEATPGPSDYDVKFEFTRNRAIGFEKQATRKSIVKERSHFIRDVRGDIDATKKRAPKTIPFDKQAPRERDGHNKKTVWEEIEEEQQAILLNLGLNEAPVREKEPIDKREPFTKQVGRKDRNPFEHLIIRSEEPTEPFNHDRSESLMSRPKTTFDMRQPAEKSERPMTIKTEAPDKFYDNVVDQWNNTQKRYGTPRLDRTQPRKSPYYYMPHSCGEGEMSTPQSTMTGKNSINIGLSGRRKTLIDSQIPPPSHSSLSAFPAS